MSILNNGIEKGPGRPSAQILSGAPNIMVYMVCNAYGEKVVGGETDTHSGCRVGATVRGGEGVCIVYYTPQNRANQIVGQSVVPNLV